MLAVPFETLSAVPYLYIFASLTLGASCKFVCSPSLALTVSLKSYCKPEVASFAPRLEV